jgi:hypothetical protein
MKKIMNSIFDWVVLGLFVIAITFLVVVHDCLAAFPAVWLKRIIRRTVEFLIVMAFFVIVNVLLFVDEYLFVGPIVWMERTQKVVVSVVLIAMLASGGGLICRALGPNAGIHSVVYLFAGMAFIVCVYLGFQYRKTICSLS